MWATLVGFVLPAAIKAAEKVIVRRSPEEKPGVDRMSVVFATAKAFIEKMVARGQWDGDLPTDDKLFGVIEATFQGLKTKGDLDAPAQDGAAVYIVTGTVKRIQ